MILLTSTSDKIQVITGSAGTIKVHASWVDNASGTITPGRTNTADISTAATTDVVAAPASSTQRNVKMMSVFNSHASVSNLCTVQHTDGTNVEILWKGTLLAGESVNYSDAGSAWQYLDANGAIKPSTGKLDSWLVVSGADVVNATTSFADITGLTVALKSGKKYMVEAHIYHITNATTTGAQFGYNIGAAPTVARFSEIATILGSATAATMAAPVGDITARDTAIIVETTGPATVVPAIISGYIQPSADGTFAMRLASEVAVASGLTVKIGSWMHVRELDN